MAEEKQTLRVSLMPEEGELWKPVNVRRRATGLVAFCVLGAGIIVSGVFYAKSLEQKKTNEISKLSAQIESIKTETGRLKQDYVQISRLVRSLLAAGALLPEHPSFVKVLALLEERTIPEVHYSNLLASAEGKTLLLEASAPTFEDAARQVAAFREDKTRVLRAAIGAMSANVSEEGIVKEIKFSITLTVKPEAFK
ncbi:hypothetical protein HYT45_03650 [Candidatus Uhrbacteria bacterium]|nr:hypothetical protein [Candidatus Uhrbacteria bacterium]